MKIIRDIPYAEESAAQELDVYMPEGKAEKFFFISTAEDSKEGIRLRASVLRIILPTEVWRW